MWIFVLEAALALGLLLFIVWWTMAPAHRREQDEARRARDAEARSRELDDDGVTGDAPPSGKQ